LVNNKLEATVKHTCRCFLPESRCTRKKKNISSSYDKMKKLSRGQSSFY